MTENRIVLVGLILCLLVGCQHGTPGPSTDDLAGVRVLAYDLEPRLMDSTDELQTAILLRNLIHQRVPLKSTAPDANFTHYRRTFYRSLLDDKYGHICGGLAYNYLLALRAFGIRARYVGIYSQATDAPKPVDSHASVEVFIDERWFVQDPTFNCTLVNEAGVALGWAEVARTIRKGAAIRADTNGYAVAESRTLGNYYISLPALCRYVVFGLTTAGQDNYRWPASWDGLVKYADGSTYNAAYSVINPYGWYAAIAR
jgi:hypothetical protein